MELEHTFTVPVAIDEAWTVLTDIERVAPCMPGAALDSVDGDDFTGTVKVKLGPISLTYKGKASWVEKDEATRRAVIDARGRDARGNGTASAKVTATLTGNGGSTTVDVITDLDITGKPAQFGRGVMVDVGNKLIGQFADCLAATLTGQRTAPPRVTIATAVPDGSEAVMDPAVALEGAEEAPVLAEPGAAPAAAPPQVRPPSPSHRRHEDVEPIDLLQSAGPAVAKRLLPVVAVLVLLVLARRRRKRRR